MTRRTRARRDSGNEAGLDFTPTTLYFAHSLFTMHLFCQFSKRCLLWGGYLVVRYLCYEACWPVLERFFEYSTFLNISSAICLQTKCTSRQQIRLTPSMVIHSISQCTILSLDTPPFSYRASIMHSTGTCLSASQNEQQQQAASSWSLEGLSDTGRN
jgi:hypothetical protein